MKKMQVNDHVLVTSDLRWQQGLVGVIVSVGPGNTYQVMFDRYEAICTLDDFSEHHNEQEAEKLFEYTDPTTVGVVRPFSGSELGLIPASLSPEDVTDIQASLAKWNPFRDRLKAVTKRLQGSGSPIE